jgi:hypothetical protein
MRSLSAIFGGVLQGIKGALKDIVPQLLFFLLGQIGIAQNVHNTTTLHNTVRANHLGH